MTAGVVGLEARNPAEAKKRVLIRILGLAQAEKPSDAAGPTA